ncbi:glucosamine-6-phosphate isomerases/6-phosphogluconolactonase domain-containing protein [Ditylenchus destructor]|nr:glucosamine-6-phosphate isomerases/6-phosphogluconolactonase domain-containing protein [Ditylenchus destructor]
MKLVVTEDYDEMSTFAANLVCKRINDFYAKEKTKYFVLGLPTGSTPLGMYKRLIEMNREGQVTFSIPTDSEQSYHTFMYQNFFRHIDIHPTRAHILNGSAVDLEDECKNFEEKIVFAGGIDLFVGGIGSDGHVAFNEPGTSLTSRTHVQSLNAETIKDNARFFGDDPTKVPAQAITVGVGTIMDSREVLMLVNGSRKALALHKVIESPISHMWTGSALQNHPNTTFVVDDDATLELKVKTGIVRDCFGSAAEPVGFAGGRRQAVRVASLLVAAAGKPVVGSRRPCSLAANSQGRRGSQVVVVVFTQREDSLFVLLRSLLPHPHNIIVRGISMVFDTTNNIKAPGTRASSPPVACLTKWCVMSHALQIV